MFILLFCLTLKPLNAQFFPVSHFPVACEGEYLQQCMKETRTIAVLKLKSCRVYLVHTNSDSVATDSILTLEMKYDSLGNIFYAYDKSIEGTYFRTQKTDSVTGKSLGYSNKVNERNDTYAVYKYDTAGNISEFSYCWPDSNFKEKYLMEYDEQHRCVKETRYEYDGAIQTGKFTYTKDSLVMDYSETHSTGAVINHIEIFYYDKQGRIIESKTVYPKDKSPNYEYRYWEYNNKGQLVQFQWIGLDGRLKRKESNLYNALGLLDTNKIYFSDSNKASVCHYYWN
ncbi:hypothetical protein BH09BAC5_BH09BAC5_21680 [soil metagenome]